MRGARYQALEREGPKLDDDFSVEECARSLWRSEKGQRRRLSFLHLEGVAMQVLGLISADGRNLPLPGADVGQQGPLDAHL